MFVPVKLFLGRSLKYKLERKFDSKSEREWSRLSN